ncbi:YdeI/OmpD-associated family protein [Kribbella sp. NPDC058245]|uniref:YdeI/OmpD-associated family protein n=1 Tax=Kribbella sp. NPDC058245 TaxID=3346399 RepID=UPI0036E06789
METFDGVIVVGDGGGAWVEVPGEVIAGLGGGGRIPVLATFDGVEYRGSIASMGGCMALGVLKGIRAELGKTAGDTVTVTVERDTAERTVDVPDDFAQALAAANLRGTFDALAFSHRREHVNAILDAKKPETRSRRITKALEMLLDRAGQDS